MRPGETIAGKYRLLRVVRSGGVSVVYRAEDVRDRRPIAVKLINVAQAALDLRRRIEREVEVLGRLDHPHIVRCYDSGALEGDRMYLALEWLEGQDLSDYKAQQPLTLRQILTLLVQLSDALELSHAEGVVHRDIKPANIYLMRPQPGLLPDARLIDFGVAKIPESEASLTRAGAILGTPSYMAPEQASQATDADGRADVFSLGVVAYELVAGRLPWESNTDLARLARILVEEPVPLEEVVPEVPDAVANLVLGMLEGDVARRIPSAAAVRDIANSCLDVLSPSELDATYVKDAALLGEFVRADTVDLVPAAPTPRRGEVRRSGSAPTGRIEDDHGLEDPAPRSVRYRSVVAAGSTVEPEPGIEFEEHDDTQELEVPRRPSAAPSLDDEPPEEPTEYRASPPAPPDPQPDFATESEPDPDDRWPSMSATAALDAVSDDDMPAVPLASLDGGGFGNLLSYVDHVPSSLLYGRVAGLDRLERRVTDPLGVAQPTLTLVIGPAGIGKTRVRTELAKLVRARRRPPRVFAGRAEESFRTTPYAFLRRMLFTEARVRPSDPPSARRAKVLRMVPEAATVRRLLAESEPAEDLDEVRGPATSAETAFLSQELIEQMGGEKEAEEDRAVVAAFLCEALGVDYPDIPPVVAARHEPRLLGQQLARALDVVLRALAEEAGLVVLVDDGHLLDRQSAQILSGLTDPTQRVPLGVVVFALPTILDADTRERSPLVADSSRTRETVQLGPLEPRASREMARSLVQGSLQDEALEMLVRQASGNPLYLEQLVGAVKANGSLSVGPDGELVLAGAGVDDFDRVPPTVAAAVSGRLSFLPPRLQRVLTAAAVFGEVFWAEGVARLVEQSVEAVMEDLDRLLVGNFVRRRAASRYQGATELEFTHAVVRSVALSRLKRRRRIEFEARAADYLEGVGEEDRAVVARHVAQGRLSQRAADLYAEAAVQALELGDPASAGILAEEGLRAAEGASRTSRVRLFGVLEQVALAHADWDGGREVMDTLADLVTSDEEEAALYLRRSRLAAMARRYEEARVEAQEAERAFGELDDPNGVANSQLCFAEASEALGDGRGALRGYLAAHVGLGEAGASAPLARSSRGLARIAASSGDYGNAENRFRAALVASRSVRDYHGLFVAESGLAEVWRAMGDPAEARGFLDEAQRVAFDPSQRLALRVLQVNLLFEEERYDDARARFERLWTGADEAGFGAVRRRAALGLGQSFRRRPSADAMLRDQRPALDEASERLRAALDEALTEDPVLLTALQLAAAVVDALRGEEDRALVLAEDAQARFQTEGALAGDEPPAVFYAVARVYQITGRDASEVRGWLKKAVGQVDHICSRLDRKARTRYLERPLARAVLEEAERAGVKVSRDVRSNRISAEGTNQ